MDILKPKTSFIFWRAKFTPANPINFSLISHLSPPIFHQDWVYPIAHYPRDLEKTHGVGRNGLGHYFNEHLPSYFWDVLLLPSHYSIGNMLLNLLKCTYLPPTIGSPRYFSQSCMTWAPNKNWISSFIAGLVLRLKNKVVFCQLIAWPKAASYWAKMDRWF